MSGACCTSLMVDKFAFLLQPSSQQACGGRLIQSFPSHCPALTPTQRYRPDCYLEFPRGGSQAMIDALVRCVPLHACRVGGGGEQMQQWQ